MVGLDDLKFQPEQFYDSKNKGKWGLPVVEV